MTSWIDLEEEATRLDFAEAVRTGLGTDPKALPSQFFYDEEGSRLFEEICALREYYLTRAETKILEGAAPDLARRLPETRALIELGSGSAVKTEVLLRAFESEEREICYAPIDVSRSALEESVMRLEERHPQLEIVAAVAEYESGLAEIKARNLAPSLTLWLGSSIGNLKRQPATRFLGQVRDSMGEEDRLLVGMDLRKERQVLEDAYDDSHKYSLAEIDALAEDAGFELEDRYQDAAGRFSLNLLRPAP